MKQVANTVEAKQGKTCFKKFLEQIEQDDNGIAFIQTNNNAIKRLPCLSSPKNRVQKI